MPGPKRRAGLLLWTAAAVVLIVGAAILMLGRRAYDDALPFDAQGWKSEAKLPDRLSHRTLRVRMVDDLLGHRALVGRSVDEALSLLGEPDQPFRASDTSELVYYLGLGGSRLLPGPELLVLGVTNGRITGVRLASD